MDDGIAAADEIEEALINAAYDNAIGSVVLRVDSPGGSPVASETILRAIDIVQRQGKSVIVSMGPAAASGGYWISAYADEIFVMPTTITGSIGVLGGKVSLQEMWEKVGVNWESIRWGRNADMWSANKPFSEEQAKQINAMLDNIYESFVYRVALGRDMTVEEVDKVARGHVWSGAAAVEIGIADQFGGLHDALDYAAVEAGGKDRHDVDVVVMPKPLTPIELFIRLLEGQVMAGQMLGTYAGYLKQFQPTLSQLGVLLNAREHSVYTPIVIK